jgi:hypothetical protein
MSESSKQPNSSAIEQFHQIFEAQEREIANLRHEVGKMKNSVEVANNEIFQQRRQAENYRSDISTLLARVQANMTLRDKNRKEVDKETNLHEEQQAQLSEKKRHLKRLHEQERERDELFIITLTNMNDMQLQERNATLRELHSNNN